MNRAPQSARRAPLAALVMASALTLFTGAAGAQTQLHYEHEFARSCGLAAVPQSLVVLELEPTSRAHGEQHVRYRLEDGVHAFCLDADDPFVTEFELRDARGRKKVHFKRAHEHGTRTHGHGATSQAADELCVRGALEQGVYTLHIRHDGRQVGSASRAAFLQPGAPTPPLLDANGDPRGGLWALAPSSQTRLAALNTWVSGPALGTPRASPSATQLANGTILVAGNSAGTSWLATAELYDPATGFWRATGAMTEGLFGVTVRLTDGRVLYVGVNSQRQPAAQLYDPSTGTWRTAAPPTAARWAQTATLLPSGLVLVAGGQAPNDNLLASAELYDSVNDRWLPTGSLNTVRAAHTATLLPSGQVLVVGGVGGDVSVGPLARTELYDPATGVWTLGNSMAVARMFHTATLLGDQILIVGGNNDVLPSPLTSAELFDISAGTFRSTGSLNIGRQTHAATLLPSGEVLISGGDDSSQTLAQSELYDPASGTFTLSGPFGAAREYHSTSVLPSGEVLAAGGTFVNQTSSHGLSSSELFQPSRSVVADNTTLTCNADALFQLSDLTHPTVFAAGGLALDLRRPGTSGLLTLVADASSSAPTFFSQTAPLVVTDLGSYRVQLGVPRVDGSLASFFLTNQAPNNNVQLNFDGPGPDPAPAPFEVLFRFFPDGSQVGTLQAGEVALFQQCNYQGKAAVLATNTADLAALSSALVTLNDSAASVLLGNDTAVTLYTDANYGGTSLLIEANTPCLSATPIGTGTASSLQVAPLAPSVLISTMRCVNCQLEGVVLDGLNLSGIDLTSADLTGASLEKTKLHKAILRESLLVRASLQGAELYGANLGAANLTGASLAGAFLNNAPGPTPGAAADLSGAHLKNVNLAQASLGGATFTNANFYSELSIAPCLADAYGFTQNCASAANANLSGTSFNGAFLYGTDFSGATVQATNFSNAVLIATTFTGATFRSDPATGAAPNLGTAFIQGTQLATQLDTTILSSAFVDFTSGGNDMYLLLNSSHAGFRGRTPLNQPVCVLVSYSDPTTFLADVATYSALSTCPDGSVPTANMPEGCGATVAANTHWRSPRRVAEADPKGSYLNDATYEDAGTPVCQPIDPSW